MAWIHLTALCLGFGSSWLGTYCRYHITDLRNKVRTCFAVRRTRPGWWLHRSCLHAWRQEANANLPCWPHMLLCTLLQQAMESQPHAPAPPHPSACPARTVHHRTAPRLQGPEAPTPERVEARRPVLQATQYSVAGKRWSLAPPLRRSDKLGSRLPAPGEQWPCLPTGARGLIHPTMLATDGVQTELWMSYAAWCQPKPHPGQCLSDTTMPCT